MGSGRRRKSTVRWKSAGVNVDAAESESWTIIALGVPWVPNIVPPFRQSSSGKCGECIQ